MVIKNIYHSFFRELPLKQIGHALRASRPAWKGQPGYELHKADGGVVVSLHSHGSSLRQNLRMDFYKGWKILSLKHMQVGRWRQDTGNQIPCLGAPADHLWGARQEFTSPTAAWSAQSRCWQMLLECLVFPLNRNCCSKVGYKLCRRFPPRSCI